MRCAQYGLFSLITLANAALQWKGADISSLITLEQSGKTFKSASGTVTPLEKILAQSGANMVRQRVWVNPSGGVYNQAYNIKLAQRVKAAGMQVYLDLHFSDTWADPGHRWDQSSIGQLTWTVYNYTLALSNAFASAGVTPELISIGNEITQGLLWPLGKNTNSFTNTASLLHSASAGIKDSNLSPKPQIMIHLDNGWNSATQSWWYSNALKSGSALLATDFDVIGVSYYPFYNSAATQSALRSSLASLANTYRKKIVVAETDWPVACSSPAYAFPADAKSIPFSAAGQTTWMQQVASIVAGVPNGLGAGLFYWEPAFLGNAGLGSSCGDNLMVDGNGQARSSMAVFGTI